MNMMAKLFATKTVLKSLLAITLLNCINASYAAPVTHGFTGTVSSVFRSSTATLLPSLPGVPSIAANAALRGRITYDSAAPVISIYGGESSQASTFYRFETPLQFEMTFDKGIDDPITISYAGNMVIRIEDNPQPGPPPKHTVELQNSYSAITGLPSSLQDWNVMFYYVMLFTSPAGLDFSPSTPALPQYIDEVMQPFYGPPFSIAFEREGELYLVDSYFTTIQTVPSVPVPPALVLFGSALLALGGMARRLRPGSQTARE
jgi:hypothetical protein